MMKNLVFVYFTTNNKNGWKSNPKKLENNNKELYDFIINYSNDFKLSELQFKQKIYHYIYNMQSVPICKICNINELKFKSINKGYSQTCSIKCSQNQPEVLNKKKQTYNENKENHKILKGKDNPLAKGNIGYINRQNNLLKEGISNVSQREEVKQLKIETFIINFGKGTEGNILLQEKKRNNSIEKNNYPHNFSKENPNWKSQGFTLPEIMNKIKIGKYEQTKNDFKLKYPNLNLVNITLDRTCTILCNICNNTYEISYNNIYQRMIKYSVPVCIYCNPLNKMYSYTEVEIKNFIQNNLQNTVVLHNDRTILKPKELDIYIPSLKIAIEYNGLWCHNETHQDKKYHLNKTQECEKQQIKLIHIFEDEWMNKREIVKSRILNILGKTPNKINGRDCQIKNVDNKEAFKFLNENHIQGSLISKKINIGLYYENELVSLMSFGDKRIVNGELKKENEYELLRFCNKLNTNIHGAGSRLFKYFINVYNPNIVLSYANRRWSSIHDNLYKKLGFDLIKISPPGYFYVIGNERKHRYNYRKDLLVKQGADLTKTEHEIMFDRKYYRIYDCGQLKYEWKNIN